MPDFEEDDGRPVDAITAGQEGATRRRRYALLYLLLGFLGTAAGIVGIGYVALKTGPAALQIVESRECFACHAELVELLKRNNVHKPFTQERCTGCHTPHGAELVTTVKTVRRLLGFSDTRVDKQGRLLKKERLTTKEAPRPKEKSKLKRPIKQLCADTCHASLYRVGRQKKVNMPPFRKKLCTSCHEVHASDHQYMLKAAVKPLCLSCHQKIAKYYLEDNIHPPFAAGSCTSCHRGHASNVKPLLKRRPRILCIGCHQPIAKFFKMATKMEPFELGLCPRCHNPHGTSTDKLLHEPVPDLCLGCHKGIAEFREKPVQMPPFRQGLCLGCHFPHGSENAKLLKAPLKNNEICFTCHGSLRENYEPIGHNKIAYTNASPYQPEGGIGSCLNCHEPHGSDYERLLQREPISLCLSCHGPRRYFTHPFGFDKPDPWRGGYLRCPSCHNPMGSGNEKLKRRPKDGLCISCHDRRAPSYIYFSVEPFHRYQIPDSLDFKLD